MWRSFTIGMRSTDTSLTASCNIIPLFVALKHNAIYDPCCRRASGNSDKPHSVPLTRTGILFLCVRLRSRTSRHEALLSYLRVPRVCAGSQRAAFTRVGRCTPVCDACVITRANINNNDAEPTWGAKSVTAHHFDLCSSSAAGHSFTTPLLLLLRRRYTRRRDADVVVGTAARTTRTVMSIFVCGAGRVHLALGLFSRI